MVLGGSLTWGNAAADASVGTPTYLGDNTWLFPISGLKSGSLPIDLAPNVDDIEDLDGVDLDPRPTSWGYYVSMLQVLSAEARSNSTVRLIFNEILNDNAALVNPDNYTFTGGGTPLTTDFVTRIDNKTVDVTVNETISEAALYTVYVETGSSGPTTAGGLSIHVNPQYNSADFTGSEPPTVVSFSPVAWTTTYTSTMDIDVTFSKEVTGVDATDMVLSNLASADAIVGTPTDLGSDTWRFPVSGLTTGSLDISLAPDPDDIEDVDGKDLVPSPTTWTYLADVTRLNSATAISATVVHLSFNESLENDAALIDPTNYTFTDGGVPLTATSVTRVDAVTVDVTVNEMTNGAIYTVYVETGLSGPTDTDGHHVDSFCNSKDFVGFGSPWVNWFYPFDNSTIATSSVDIKVSFFEPVTGVDATDLVLTGSAAGSATVGTPTHPSTYTWWFPVSGLENGTLNISLAPDPNDIEDADGNDLYPRPTTWNYTVNITRVEFAEPLALNNTVRVQFSNEMTDDGALVTPTNYTFSGGGVPPYSRFRHPR